MLPSPITTVRRLAQSPAAWAPLALCTLGAVAWLVIRNGAPALHGAVPASKPAPAAVITAPSATTPAAPTVAAVASAASPPSVVPSASILKVIVSRNDTLDRIFRRLQLDLADLASVRMLPGLKQRLDRLQPGEALTFEARDGQLVGLERRLSLDETLKVVRDDSGFQAQILKEPLETRPRTISATIDSSLFEAVTGAGAHDQTALALADIFAWDIDFVLDIQPGDSFTITYEELFRDGKYLQDGPILAARFVNQGHEYLAVRYVSPSGAVGYYTPDGHSMRKAFLRAPLEFTRISSRFDLHRHHPILNLIRAHKGIDYAAPIGTPVKAAGDGRVIFAGQKGGYGNVVEIDHARGIVTVYGHLSRFARGTRPGAHVTQGSVIAYVGMTGLATGPHLHYEYRVNGVHKNPQTVGLPDAVPIDEQLRPDFLSKTEPLLATLNAPLGPALVSR
jgi:murein DD-endopeptidase MepM/ murein hydrolase activator NlpD